MDITEEGFKWFQDHEWPRYQQQGNGIAEGLKRYLKDDLEKRLTGNHQGTRANAPIMRQKPEKPNIEIKIVDIAFAYNNAKLIALLRERGQHIIYQRFDKMREVE